MDCLLSFIFGLYHLLEGQAIMRRESYIKEQNIVEKRIYIFINVTKNTESEAIKMIITSDKFIARTHISRAGENREPVRTEWILGSRKNSSQMDGQEGEA